MFKRKEILPSEEMVVIIEGGGGFGGNGEYRTTYYDITNNTAYSSQTHSNSLGAIYQIFNIIKAERLEPIPFNCKMNRPAVIKTKLTPVCMCMDAFNIKVYLVGKLGCTLVIDEETRRVPEDVGTAQWIHYLMHSADRIEHATAKIYREGSLHEN